MCSGRRIGYWIWTPRSRPPIRALPVDLPTSSCHRNPERTTHRPVLPSHAACPSFNRILIRPPTCSGNGELMLSSLWLSMIEVTFSSIAQFGTPCVCLTLLRGGGGGQQILNLSQAPNRESNDVNHTEP
jgi:hypothetical protein